MSLVFRGFNHQLLGKAFRKIVFGIDFEQLERDHEELLAEAAAAAEPLPETGADTPSAGCSEIREYEKRSFSQSIKMLQNLQALFLFMQNSDRDSISPHCFVKSFRDDGAFAFQGLFCHSQQRFSECAATTTINAEL